MPVKTRSQRRRDTTTRMVRDSLVGIASGGVDSGMHEMRDAVLRAWRDECIDDMHASLPEFPSFSLATASFSVVALRARSS